MSQINYEEFYDGIKDLSKQAESTVNDAHKAVKKMNAGLGGGDLKAVEKQIEALKASLSAASESLSSLQEKVAAFDQQAYVREGSFKEQIILACQERNIDVKDDGGMILEMFPSRMIINPETLDVSIDKKKESCLRPAALAEKVKKTRERLEKASFNADKFLEEFARAYETALLLRGKKGSAYVKLTDIYKCLAPTSRAKKDYDSLSYAFDLARLYNSGLNLTKNGKALTWDTSRQIAKGNAIRILDQGGHENYLNAVKFEDSKL